MWCFSWARRATLRVSSEGLSSEMARMTRASRKYLYRGRQSSSLLQGWSSGGVAIAYFARRLRDGC
jgi:hypothetical protein